MIVSRRVLSTGAGGIWRFFQHHQLPPTRAISTSSIKNIHTEGMSGTALNYRFRKSDEKFEKFDYELKLYESWKPKLLDYDGALPHTFEAEDCDDEPTTADGDDINGTDAHAQMHKYTFTDEKYADLAWERMRKLGIYDPSEICDLELQGAITPQFFDYNRCIEVHKRFLVASSPYFAEKLAKVEAFRYEEMRYVHNASRATQYTFWEFDHANLERICLFIYFGELRISNSAEMMYDHPIIQLNETLRAAEKLEIAELEAACVHALLSPTFVRNNHNVVMSGHIYLYTMWLYANLFFRHKTLQEGVVRKVVEMYPDSGQWGDELLRLELPDNDVDAVRKFQAEIDDARRKQVAVNVATIIEDKKPSKKNEEKVAN